MADRARAESRLNCGEARRAMAAALGGERERLSAASPIVGASAGAQLQDGGELQRCRGGSERSKLRTNCDAQFAQAHMVAEQAKMRQCLWPEDRWLGRVNAVTQVACAHAPFNPSVPSMGGSAK